MSEYYYKNRERILEYQRQYNNNNKDKIKEYQHSYWVNVRKKKYIKKLKPKMVVVKIKIIKPETIKINQQPSYINGLLFFN
jgi:hypothetical protein